MTLHGVRRGDGPPLVLLHGITMSAAAWDPVLDLLAGHHEVLALDAPGHGQSPPLPAGERYNPATQARLVIETMASHGWDRAHLAGNSMGGRTAIEVGALGHALTVTAISPAGGANRAEEKWAKGMLITTMALAPRLAPRLEKLGRRVGVRKAACGIVHARAERVPPRVLAAEAADVARSDGRRALREVLGEAGLPTSVPCPVTIAWGSRDLLLPVWQRHRVAAAIPHADVRVLPGLGHVPMWDDPELVADAILRTTGAI